MNLTHPPTPTRNFVKTPLKLAFLGGGINSAVGRVHRIAAEMDHRFELVSGCFSRHSDTNRETAREYGIERERNYPDLATLINAERGQIDAIVILTPTPQHKDNVIQCLQAGIPVICDKALAASCPEVQEIRETLKVTGGYLAVTYNYSGYPMLRELKALINRNTLGNIEQIHIEMPQESFARLDQQGCPPTPQDWRLHDGVLPTLALDLGVHLHQSIEFLTSTAPLEVVAVQNYFGAFKQIVDNTLCIANYDRGMVCHLWFSKAALGHRNGLKIRVYGQSGAAEWYQTEPETLRLYDTGGRHSILDRSDLRCLVAQHPRYNRFKAGHPAGFIEAFANHYYDIADNLLAYQLNGRQSKHEYVFGVDTAADGLALLTAIKTSAETKSWISVANMTNTQAQPKLKVAQTAKKTAMNVGPL